MKKKLRFLHDAGEDREGKRGQKKRGKKREQRLVMQTLSRQTKGTLKIRE